jgi:hypothetical protein
VREIKGLISLIAFLCDCSRTSIMLPLLSMDKNTSGPVISISARSCLTKPKGTIRIVARKSRPSDAGLGQPSPSPRLLPIQMKGYEAMKQRVEIQIKHQADQRTYFDASLFLSCPACSLLTLSLCTTTGPSRAAQCGLSRDHTEPLLIPRQACSTIGTCLLVACEIRRRLCSPGQECQGF